MAEIITVERRRRWSDEDKRRIVAETLEASVSVSAVAKRHGLYPSQLFGWRRALRDSAVRPAGDGLTEFTPVVVPEPPDASPRMPAPEGIKPAGGRIEIILGQGHRILVGPDVDASALRRVLDVLGRR